MTAYFRITVEDLLAHRSGIGDYLDEDDDGEISDYVLPVPVHRLADTEDYLAVLGGFPQVFAPGERFAYNNGGFVVLALLAERASGASFRRLVAERVCGPAGMADTAFHRLDEPPGPDVLDAMTWLPLVTFCQVTADLPRATAVPPGHGHTYGAEYVDAWATVLQPAERGPRSPQLPRALTQEVDRKTTGRVSPDSCVAVR